MGSGLQRVIIQNFLSHKDTQLDLVAGVNTIIGDTDNGKSAAFKALQWLFTNKPSGNEYRSWWGGDTHVAVELDGIRIGRIRSSTKNYYYIGEDIPKNRLEAFGQSVPDPVVKLLNLEEVNFQSQMSLPFLLSQSAGKVGKFLNDAAELNVIDRAISNIASVLRKEKEGLETAKADFAKHTEDLKAYEWLDSANADLIKLEGLNKEVDLLGIQAKRLDELLDAIDGVEQEIEKVQPVLVAGPELERLAELQTETEKLSGQVVALDRLLDDIDKVEQDIEQQSKVLAALPGVNLLTVLQAEIENFRKQESQLSSLLGQIRNVEQDYGREKKELAIMETAFHKSFPAVCPLCNQEVR